MSNKNVAVIGAGIAGIATGLALKKQLRFNNFIIYEKGEDVGGTWRENTYPGCGCDVPSYWYSLSDAQNPKWSKTYSSQPEIQAYLHDVVVKRDILPHIRFGAKLVDAIWDNDIKGYRLEIEYTTRAEDGTKTTRTEHSTADILISAIGALHAPEFPHIKGLETFKGDLFHAAQWRHDVSLHGKRVGIIGNGCSATQIIPVISQDETTEVVNFCRTPSWFMPRRQVTIPSFVKWIFRYIPFFLYLTRFYLFIIHDISYLIWKKGNSWPRRAVEALMRMYIRRKAPAHLHDKLIPKYTLGCKRIIRDPGYLSSLNRPNVATEWDAIAEIVEDGIITKNGTKHQLDVIVPATGFSVDHMAGPVRGTGPTMSEYFNANGGPTAYRGTTLPSFPNFFTILGPNVASGHASAIFVEEVQVNYVIKMIRPIVEGRVLSVDVKEEETNAYNDELQKRIKTTVWDGCLSYYNQQGGKNIAMFPGTVTKFWRMMRSPEWKHYHVEKESNGRFKSK